MNLKQARILVCDTETTGLDPETDKVCEVGWCEAGYNDEQDQFKSGLGQSVIINPGVPIPPVTSAVHHLTDRDVVGKPSLEQFLGEFGAGNYDLIVAHNADFDSAFLKDMEPEIPWLCTYRLARHLFPDAPSHKNQVLRYMFGFIDVPGDAHRADHDAKVTALNLCRMLNTHMLKHDERDTIQSIVAFAESPVYLTNKMNFGKHADWTWQECLRQDRGYLQWMAKQGKESASNPNGWDRDVWYTIHELLEGRVPS